MKALYIEENQVRIRTMEERVKKNKQVRKDNNLVRKEIL